LWDKLDTNTIIWKSEYNIHNFKLDKEHQELFNIAREALHISKIKDDEQEISTKLKEIISKLFDYIKTHFVHEEDYMKKINYPELEEHKFLHKNITTMLTSLISDLNKLKLSEIGLSLFNFIEEYFIKHIVNEDKKIELWRTSICALKRNFHWKNIYTIGVEEIDSEHKELFGIVQEMFLDIQIDIRHEKIKEVLTNLYVHLNIHFKHEEDYMKKINYPYLEKHKKSHKYIMENLNDFVKNLSNLDKNLFEKELVKIIDITFVYHVIKEDKKITIWEKNNLKR
jgi:hemerythrin